MQVCVISYRVLWTALVERALRSMAGGKKGGGGGNPRALAAVHDYMRLRLGEVVEEARRPATLPTATRGVPVPAGVMARAVAAGRRRNMVIDALVTVQTHHRDVCAALVKDKPRGVDGFAWKRHLRSYYEVRPGGCPCGMVLTCVAVLLCCCLAALLPCCRATRVSRSAATWCWCCRRGRDT